MLVDVEARQGLGVDVERENPVMAVRVVVSGNAVALQRCGDPGGAAAQPGGDGADAQVLLDIWVHSVLHL